MGLLVFGAGCLSDEPKSGGALVYHVSEVSEPVLPQVFDGDLRDLPRALPWQPGAPTIEVARQRHGKLPDEKPSHKSAGARDPLVDAQRLAVQYQAFTPPDINVPGLGFTGARPPDTVGDVGPDHYIQMVNDPSGAIFAVYDKAGNDMTGATLLSSLWTAGGDCASGAGDPIVLYDRLADRWLLSEFADIGNHLCVYISQSPDPIAGGWFLYDFTTPDFPDYPKYAVWPDAYFVTTNESNPAVYGLDRVEMLAGNPATSQRFTAPDLAGFGFQALTPGDLDGATPPPPGAPGLFMRHNDDEVHSMMSDPTQDFLEIWELDIDFDIPANSTFTGPMNIAVAEFDSDLCGLVSFFCFPQPDTANTLDPLREVIMWRLQYRNFGTHETLLGNLVTDVDGTDHGGVRWFELRQSGAGWTLFQEGTYAPDDNHRWMGSMAMDGDGNIALGYSISSDTVFPSMRYTGRMAGDALGTMTQPETTIIAGTGSQTSTTRWGDYSAMSVDPADDCTFWHTNEYMPMNGQWETQIAAFRFAGCGNEPPVAICQDVTVDADDMCQADVAPADVDGGSFDPDGDPITLDLTPPGPYDLGDTSVTLTVTDDDGAEDSCMATVTVVDVTPPDITGVSADPDVLWPPNHKMVSVTVDATATDACNATPQCQIVDVTSDEPVNDSGDGDTSPDWNITGALTVDLRAERAGTGDGRTYTITVECTDDAGNSATGMSIVIVPLVAP